MATTECDIAIIGGGIAGSITACILARHGVRATILDHGGHPRFAIGESMIPLTSHLLRIMADRYGIPELDHCSTFTKLRRHVTSSSGIKRNFSFVHHVKGATFNPRNATMLPIEHYPHGAEAHLMRQDIDAFLYAAAIRYGAKTLDHVAIAAVDVSPLGAEVRTTSGDTVRCKYVVDASGYNSVIAKQFNLREQPSRLKSFTRSLFTHMVGVKPYEDVYGRCTNDLPQPLSQGTLHHIFDGGWLWVIPFNNYHSATNPLCSVGLQLDSQRFPDTGKGPESEFRQFLEDYPEIAPQFADAKPVRRWVSTSRLQYSSNRVVGPRYCLLAHAAGFVDPLFSRGLHVTMETINALAHRLIDAVGDDDFSDARFSYLETLTQSLIDSHDRLTHGSLIAFRDFELWNAWYRVWALGGSLSSLRFRSAHVKFKLSGDAGHLAALENHQYLGTPSPEVLEYQRVFMGAYETLVKVESGELSISDAIRCIYRLYDAPWIPPMYGMTDPDKHFISAGDITSFVDATIWGYTAAPEEIRQRFFDIPSSALVGQVTAAFQQEREWMDRVALDFEYPGGGDTVSQGLNTTVFTQQMDRLERACGEFASSAKCREVKMPELAD
jgi:FADH2 O2-dependent halogenase